MALASLAALRSRNFALLWSSALVSNVGSWMQGVALGIFVTARTHEPLWTGLVAAAAFLPNGLLAPVGGVLADRLDRRRWLLVTTCGETLSALVLTLLAASGDLTPTGAVLLAFAGGVFAAVGLASYQAMLPDLVPKEHLLAAVSLSSAQYNLGRVVGPALAGAALLFGSYSTVFAVNTVSFGAVLVALVLVRLPAFHRSGPAEGLWTQLRAGARIARNEEGCRSAIGLIGLVALLISPFIALVPAMAIVGLHLGTGNRGEVGTSVLVVAQGVGAVLGALLLPGLAARVGRRRQVTASLFAVPVAVVLYGFAPDLALAALALFLVGFCYIGVLSGLNTVVQLRAPASARGRVLSLFMLALGVVYPLAAVVHGSLSGRLGVREVTVATALIFLLVLVALRAARPGAFLALGDPEAAPAPAPGDGDPVTGADPGRA